MCGECDRVYDRWARVRVHDQTCVDVCGRVSDTVRRTQTSLRPPGTPVPVHSPKDSWTPTTLGDTRCRRRGRVGGSGVGEGDLGDDQGKEGGRRVDFGGRGGNTGGNEGGPETGDEGETGGRAEVEGVVRPVGSGRRQLPTSSRTGRVGTECRHARDGRSREFGLIYVVRVSGSHTGDTGTQPVSLSSFRWRLGRPDVVEEETRVIPGGRPTETGHTH